MPWSYMNTAINRKSRSFREQGSFHRALYSCLSDNYITFVCYIPVLPVQSNIVTLETGCLNDDLISRCEKHSNDFIKLLEN